MGVALILSQLAVGCCFRVRAVMRLDFHLWHFVLAFFILCWVFQEMVASGNILDIIGAAVIGAVIMFLLMHSRAASTKPQASVSTDSEKSKQSAKSTRSAGEFGNFDVPTTLSLIQTRRSIFPKVRFAASMFIDDVTVVAQLSCVRR